MFKENKGYLSIVAEVVAEVVDLVVICLGPCVLGIVASALLSAFIAGIYDKEYGEGFFLIIGVECIIWGLLFCWTLCALPVTIPCGRAMRSLNKAINDGNHDETVRQIEWLRNYRLIHSPRELLIRWDKKCRTAVEWFFAANENQLAALVCNKMLSDEEFARLIPYSIFELRLKQVMSDWEGVLRYLDRQIHAYGKNYNPPPALVADLLIKFLEQCSLDWLDEKGREDLIRFVLEKTRTDVYPILVLQKGFRPLPSILESEDKAFEGFLAIVRTVDAETGAALVMAFVKEMSMRRDCKPAVYFLVGLVALFPAQCSLNWLDETGRDELIRLALKSMRADVYPTLVLQRGFRPLPSESEYQIFEGFLAIVRTVDAETGAALVTAFVKEMSMRRDCKPAVSFLAGLVALFPAQCSLDWLDETGRDELIRLALESMRADVYPTLVLQKNFCLLPSSLESEDKLFKSFLSIVRSVDVETGTALVSAFVREMSTGRKCNPASSILADLVALFPEQCSLDWLDEKGRADLICFALENERTDVYLTLVLQQGLPLLPPTVLFEKGISKRVMTEVKANSLFRHFLVIVQKVDPKCNIALGDAFVKEMATPRDYSFYPELVFSWVNTYPGHAMSAWFTIKERETAIRKALENRQTYSYYSLVVQGGFRFFPSDVTPKEEWFEAVVEMATHLCADQVMTLVQAMTRDEAKQILGYAIQKDVKTLYLLLCKTHGLSLLTSSKSGYTPMMMAAYLGDIELFDMLIALPDGPQMVWERTYDGKTLVDFASEARNGAFLNHFRTFQRKQELRQLEGVSAQEAELLETERKAGELANSLMAEEIDRNDDECK